MKFGEIVAVATLVATVLMLIFALYVFIKEFQIKSLKNEVRDLEKKVDENIRHLKISRSIDELCGKYLEDSESERASDLQKLKISLNSLVYATTREEVECSLVTIGGYLNHNHYIFYTRMKYFYVRLWEIGHFKKYKFENEFRQEYFNSFDERIDDLF